MNKAFLYIIITILAITTLGIFVGIRNSGVFNMRQTITNGEKAQGAVSGKVTIGPLCPVEPCPKRHFLC